MPTAAKLPEYFRTHKYQNPKDSRQSTFVHALGSEFWSYMKKHPSASATFNSFMESRREGRPSWFEPYPVEENLLSKLDSSSDAVLLIDIGGNHGHDLTSFKTQYPKHSGRLILQDQLSVIKNLCGQLEGIEYMPHDFFEPQPVKGQRKPKRWKRESKNASTHANR